METAKRGWGQMAVLGLQHMFAVFGATILVPAVMEPHDIRRCARGACRNSAQCGAA